MKKAVLLLSLLVFSSLADANPLLFPNCSVIEIKGNYEYFYDEFGELIGREDVGSSGSVYGYWGDGDWREEGYFIEENGWCLYYCTWLDNAYVGKGKSSSELFRDGDGLYDRVSRFYVDARNRPVATYYERLSGQMGDSFKQIFGYMENMLDPLGAILNGGKPAERRILVLKGTVRRYID